MSADGKFPGPTPQPLGLPGLSGGAEMWLDRPALAAQLTRLAGCGVYLGTSSWKYPGWCGMLYDRSRYERRGRFAEARFNKECLAEYAKVFRTVCVDAAYYNFPSQQYLEGMVNETPDDFFFALKVTDAITIKKFPSRAARHHTVGPRP